MQRTSQMVRSRKSFFTLVHATQPYKTLPYVKREKVIQADLADGALLELVLEAGVALAAQAVHQALP